MVSWSPDGSVISVAGTSGNVSSFSTGDSFKFLSKCAPFGGQWVLLSFLIIKAVDSLLYVDNSTAILGSDGNVSIVLINLATGVKYHQLSFDNPGTEKVLFNIPALHLDSQTLILGSSICPSLYSFHFNMSAVKSDYVGMSSANIFESKQNIYLNDSIKFGMQF